MKTLAQNTIPFLHIGQLLFKGDVTGSYDSFINSGGKRYLYHGVNEYGDIGISDYPAEPQPDGYNQMGVTIIWEPKENVFKSGDWHFLQTVRTTN